MKFSRQFLYATMNFMQEADREVGGMPEEKIEAMLDAFDPSLKREILIMILKGETAGAMTIRSVVNVNRQKINAIKEIRAATGFGLKEAKDVADEVDARGYSTIPGNWSYETRKQLDKALLNTGYEVL